MGCDGVRYDSERDGVGWHVALTTAGPVTLRSIQSSAATMPLVEPLPVQPNTRTATTDASLAAPYDRPAAVPATCVPCLR